VEEINEEEIGVWKERLQTVKQPYYSFTDLYMVPPHLFIPPLQQFMDAPYKFSTAFIKGYSRGMVFGGEEALFYLPENLSYNEPKMFWVTRKSKNLYSAPVPTEIFPKSLSYYIKSVPLTYENLQDAVDDHFGVFVYVEGGELYKQGHLELLKVTLNNHSLENLYRFHAFEQTDTVFNHKFSKQVYRIRGSNLYFLETVKEVVVKSSDHEDLVIPKGHYFIYHPEPDAD